MSKNENNHLKKEVKQISKKTVKINKKISAAELLDKFEKNLNAGIFGITNEEVLKSLENKRKT